MIGRREFLRTGLRATAAAAAIAGGLGACRRDDRPRWSAAAYAKRARSRVAVLAAEEYDESLLVQRVLDGLRAFDLPLRGRRVVLKPNLVEFDPAGVVNTNPTLVAAAGEAFRRLGAAEIVVAEGPGHRRDNEYLLTASGFSQALAEIGAPYVDLNTDAVREMPLRSRYTTLSGLYLPETALSADLIVSMPKMKTHHWAGVTLSMKNLFGLVPGSVYGWPKNLLHWEGIEESILDVNACLPVPRFNLVDGILGMEGNGPIQGEPKKSGVLVFGRDPVAVDATCARLMSIDPWEIGYLREAGAFLGNVEEERIEQVGEDPDAFRRDYDVLESFQHTKITPRASAG